jgi:hypothetical protein
MKPSIATSRYREDHIPPNLVWSFLHHDGELPEDDRNRILECNECIEMFVICLKSDSFISALMSLRHPPTEK